MVTYTWLLHGYLTPSHEITNSKPRVIDAFQFLDSLINNHDIMKRLKVKTDRDIVFQSKMNL